MHTFLQQAQHEDMHSVFKDVSLGEQNNQSYGYTAESVQCFIKGLEL